MISTIELYKAIRERLESAFPNVLIQQKDIKNITRPSFYIQYVGKNFDKIALEYYEDRISFNIVYFAQKESLLELLEIEETFIRSFNSPLSIADDNYIVGIEKDGIQTNINEDDYYINMTVDFVLSQRAITEETGEMIENLEMTVENESENKLSEYSDVDSDSLIEDNNDIMSDIDV